MAHPEWLIVGTSTTAFLLLLGHWARCPRPMPRLWRYVYGVASINVGFAIWQFVGEQDWVTVAGLATISAAGGLAVFVAYGWDGVVNAVSKARKAEAADDEL